MADQKQTSTRRPVFKRYSALEVLEEVLNDQDSGDEDLQGPDDIDSDEEESDCNQHHPILSKLVADDVVNPNFEPSEESGEESDSQDESGHDDEAEPIPSKNMQKI